MYRIIIDDNIKNVKKNLKIQNFYKKISGRKYWGIDMRLTCTDENFLVKIKKKGDV